MISGKNLICFKAYDVRGRLGEELNEDIVPQNWARYCTITNAKTVVLGFDARASSPILADAVVKVFAALAPMFWT